MASPFNFLLLPPYDPNIPAFTSLLVFGPTPNGELISSLFPCHHLFLHSRDLFHLCNYETGWPSARMLLNGTQTEKKQKGAFSKTRGMERRRRGGEVKQGGWQDREQSMSFLCRVQLLPNSSSFFPGAFVEKMPESL